ncbi:MAG: transcriptional regulator [Nocardiopsaceae bacterium]|nr:transcriptional regulator [Nocardiopsaceae bacterium]
MVSYLYRCPERHETTADAPMGKAAPHVECACGEQARRAFTAPMLSSLPRAGQRAVEGAMATAEAPAVVTEVPPAYSAPGPASDPRHSLLPRP